MRSIREQNGLLAKLFFSGPVEFIAVTLKSIISIFFSFVYNRRQANFFGTLVPFRDFLLYENSAIDKVFVATL